jgi:TolB protein
MCRPAGAAELVFRITGADAPLPVAVVPFATTAQVPVDVADVIAADLARSGRFEPMPVADMPSQPSEFGAVRFADWRRLDMDNLVIGTITQSQPGRFDVAFRVVDVFRGTQLAGYRIAAPAANLRLAAHHIADIVYEAITGQKGAFATQVAYVTADKDAQGKKQYTLQLADSDGFNAKTLLESPAPIMSPAWSPDGERIAYVSFEDKNSAIYIQSIRTGERQLVASGPGINSSPAFAPDGRRLAMTLSREGNPDIYIKDLASGQVQRITTDPAIDTEATWMPDGRALLFTSDRGGGPQIYRVDLASGQQTRITRNQGAYNARPRLSPDGKLLAMVTGGDRGYHIGILNLQDDSFRILSEASQDESPSFAPSGTMLLYTTLGPGGTELAATSVDGRIRQRLALARGEVREPAWGPFRQ